MHKETDNIKVVITSDSAKHRGYIQNTIEKSGLRVILNEPLTTGFLQKLETAEADVVILDMESVQDEHLDYLDSLLEQDRLPVIINDVSALTLNEPKSVSKWHKKLLEKISMLTGKSSWDKNVSGIDSKYRNQSENTGSELAKNVWVLGASLGGPDALKRFLIHVPEDLPVAFIVAQHLGENFVTLLAEQLDRYTDFNVIVPETGHVVRHREVLITPTDARIKINPIGAVELIRVDEEMKYTPSIDMAIDEIAQRYKDKSGAIIFSGMCDDGVKGCRSLTRLGGQVWVQNPESCVISEMPESVMKSVKVTYSNSPQEMAKHLVSLYSVE